MKVIISPEARDDLQAIKAHSERRWGDRQAAATALRIQAAWRALARFPGLARPVEGRPWLRIEASPHVVVVERRGKMLHVLRVLDARRDPEHMFD